jgi:hypothetical protein
MINSVGWEMIVIQFCETPDAVPCWNFVTLGNCRLYGSMDCEPCGTESVNHVYV